MTLLSSFAVQPGAIIQFSYPVDNRFRVSTRLIRRRFAVESVRNCNTEPIEPWAVSLRPNLRRGQLLVIGHDLDKYVARSFYVDSMRSIRPIELQLSRLAVYDPCDDSNRLRWFGPVFTDSKADVERVRQILQRIRQLNESDEACRRSCLSVGLFSFDSSTGEVTHD